MFFFEINLSNYNKIRFSSFKGIYFQFSLFLDFNTFFNK